MGGTHFCVEDVLGSLSSDSTFFFVQGVNYPMARSASLQWIDAEAVKIMLVSLLCMYTHYHLEADLMDEVIVQAKVMTFFNPAKQATSLNKAHLGHFFSKLPTFDRTLEVVLERYWSQVTKFCRIPLAGSMPRV